MIEYVSMQIAIDLIIFISKGYVHRDIKPENVLFTADGNCKLVRLASLL